MVGIIIDSFFYCRYYCLLMSVPMRFHSSMRFLEMSMIHFSIQRILLWLFCLLSSASLSKEVQKMNLPIRMREVT